MHLTIVLSFPASAVRESPSLILRHSTLKRVRLQSNFHPIYWCYINIKYTFTSDTMDKTNVNNGHQPKQYKRSNDNDLLREVGNQDKVCRSALCM